VVVAAARCNRCGACLALACPAISDPGGEAMAVDPAVCTGCGLCAPLCRSRAIGPPPATPGRGERRLQPRR
jgi:indolepyruvate ferredoxin oxidoreductase alpha subunit